MTMRSMKSIAVIASLALLLVAGVAAARSVFLNGANIDSVRNESLKKVDVFIDSEGNVHIEAPGYKVMEESSAAPPVAPAASGANPALQNRYFLVVDSSRPGAAQYDVEVDINGQLARKIQWNDPQLIAEVSMLLKPGRNQVRIVATKNLSSPRTSTSENDQMKVLIGRGQAMGQQVTIDSSLVVFTCSAADSQTFDRPYVLDAH